MWRFAILVFCAYLLAALRPVEGAPANRGEPASDSVYVTNVTGDEPVGYVDRDAAIANSNSGGKAALEVKMLEESLKKTVEECNVHYKRAESEGATPEELQSLQKDLKTKVDEATARVQQRANALERELEAELYYAISEESKLRKLKGFNFDAAQKSKCIDITAGVITRLKSPSASGQEKPVSGWSDHLTRSKTSPVGDPKPAESTPPPGSNTWGRPLNSPPASNPASTQYPTPAASSSPVPQAPMSDNATPAPSAGPPPRLATPGKPRPSPLASDIDYRRFQGSDGGRFYGADPQFARQLQIRILRPGVIFDLPTLDGMKMCFVEVTGSPLGVNSLRTGHPLEQLMIHAVDLKSQSNNVYVRLTADTVKKLEQRVLAAPQGITPAEMMEMSLSVCGNNYPLAVLTAHNFLKDITYLGRQSISQLSMMASRGKPVKFPPRYGSVAAQLVNMRTAPGDKMGIWYHSFVPLVIAAWTDIPEAGDQAIREEYAMRRLASVSSAYNMNSPVDSEKEASDKQFAEIAHNVDRMRPSRTPELVICEAKLTPTRVKVGEPVKFEMMHQLKYLPKGSLVTTLQEVLVLEPDSIQEVPVVRQRTDIDTNLDRSALLHTSFAPVKPGRHRLLYKVVAGQLTSGGEANFDVEGAQPANGLVRECEPELRVEHSPGSLNLQREGAKIRLVPNGIAIFYYSDWKLHPRNNMLIHFTPPPEVLTAGQKFQVSATISGDTWPPVSGSFNFQDIMQRGIGLDCTQCSVSNSNADRGGGSLSNTGTCVVKAAEQVYEQNPVVTFNAYIKGYMITVTWRYRKPAAP